MVSSNNEFDEMFEALETEADTVVMDEARTTMKVQWLEPMLRYLSDISKRRIPPFRIDDSELLFYDIFLLLNLSLSVSFYVVHRMSFQYLLPALSEGSLLCILWVLAGWFRGAFTYTAVDGNRVPEVETAGPKAAGLLGFHTFINASCLRVSLSLVQAISQHRPVGGVAGEDLMLVEITFGLVLMTMWRWLHSSFTPRM